MNLLSEITRQIDKSITNAIGTFHEEVLGGVAGYEIGNQSAYDIKASDNSLFADIKNKHNTMNSKAQEALYQILIGFADNNPTSKCYCVHILSTSSYMKRWNTSFSKRIYNHNQVYICSGDKFYELITGESDALYQIYKMLPTVIADYFQINNITPNLDNNSSALVDIQQIAARTTRTLLNQIAHDNYSTYYDGFDEL